LGWGTGLCVFSFELAPSILKQQNHFLKKPKQIRVCYVFKTYSLDDTHNRKLVNSKYETNNEDPRSYKFTNYERNIHTQRTCGSEEMKQTFRTQKLELEKQIQ